MASGTSSEGSSPQRTPSNRKRRFSSLQEDDSSPQAEDHDQSEFHLIQSLIHAPDAVHVLFGELPEISTDIPSPRSLEQIDAYTDVEAAAVGLNTSSSSSDHEDSSWDYEEILTVAETDLLQDFEEYYGSLLSPEQSEDSSYSSDEEMNSVCPIIVLDEEEAVGDTCCICLEEMAHGQVTRKLPCGHSNHRMCIDTWMEGQSTCPMCRKSIL